MPAAEKVTPLIVKSRSAVGQIIAALFPPSSSKFLPNRAETKGAIALPIAQLPVAESRAIFSSSANSTEASFAPFLIKTKSLYSPATESHIFFVKSAHPSL